MQNSRCALLGVALPAFLHGCGTTYTVTPSAARSAVLTAAGGYASVDALERRRAGPSRSVVVAVRVAQTTRPTWAPGAPPDVRALTEIPLSETADIRYAPYLSSVEMRGPPGLGAIRGGWISAAIAVPVLTAGVVLLSSALRCFASASGFGALGCALLKLPGIVLAVNGGLGLATGLVLMGQGYGVRATAVEVVEPR